MGLGTMTAEFENFPGTSYVRSDIAGSNPILAFKFQRNKMPKKIIHMTFLTPTPSNKMF